MSTNLQLSNNLEHFVNNIIDQLFIVVAIGVVAMSFVELFKVCFFIRRHYHRKMFENWLGVSFKCKKYKWLYKKLEKWFGLSFKRDKHNKLYDDFCYLIVGDESNFDDWFDQSTDQIFPQLHSVSQVVIESNEDFNALFTFLIGTEMKDKIYLHMEKQSLFDDQDYLRLLANASHLASRRIEVFRLHIDFKWKRINQALGLIFSILITYLLTYLPPDPSNSVAAASPSEAVASPLETYWFLLLGTLSGVVAPVSKDIISNLTSLQFRR